MFRNALDNLKTYKSVWTGGATAALLFFALFAAAPLFLSEQYSVNSASSEELEADDGAPSAHSPASHIATPDVVKALYMASWTAGTPSVREKVTSLIEETEANAVVIDIKDDTGRISFDVLDPRLEEIGSENVRVEDMRSFIAGLHEKGVYVIGRIAVFQDPYMTMIRPDLAVKRESDGLVWRDRKGLSWIDPGAEEMWEYVAAIGKEAYNAGFDELNYDYIRFPSDGDMQDIAYPYSEKSIIADPTYGKADILNDFFAFLNAELKLAYSTGTPQAGPMVSADLFGMTTTAMNDMNIGQIIEYALEHFDYVAPMVYPSHYPFGFAGYGNPNEHSYEIVRYSLDSAIARAVATSTPLMLYGLEPIASTTPQLYRKEAVSKHKLRPWLQDFDYGGDYNIAEVRAQIQATYDAGLNSFMLWDPSNNYTKEALLKSDMDVVPAPHAL